MNFTRDIWTPSLSFLKILKVDYQAIQNAQRNKCNEFFRQPTEDAQTLKDTLLQLKISMPNFLAEILKDETTNKFQAIVFGDR